jgi:hypothetical protein
MWAQGGCGRRGAAGICLGRRDPRHLAAHFRPQLCRHLLAAGGGHCIGLFGVAASFSAQVLARRKEFGLLAHLGLTRRQILAWWPAKARPGR